MKTQTGTGKTTAKTTAKKTAKKSAKTAKATDERVAKAAAAKPATKTAKQGAGKPGKTREAAKAGSGRSNSMPRAGKDPKGGLTAEGRKFFAEKDGSHLRPGVRGAADTPEKMMRKGSFLRRHYANPPGPVVDEKGEPTRQALQAAAWGEPLPKDEADEKRLAEKGTELLEQYHEAKGDAPKKGAKRAGAKKGS